MTHSRRKCPTDISASRSFVARRSSIRSSMSPRPRLPMRPRPVESRSSSGARARQETTMFNHATRTGRFGHRSRAFRGLAVTVSVLLVLSTMELGAQRKSGGGSVKQSRSTSSNAGANRSNNYNRSTNTTPNRNTNTNRNTNANNNVNRNNNNTNVNVNNVDVNRNTNVNNAGYYGRPGGVVAGEEGAVAVGRRGAVAVGEEGFVGVGRYGGVVSGEVYDSYEGWRVAAGVATGIAVGTMLARPPATHVTVIAGGANYMYADGAYYEQVMYGGEVTYRVVQAPVGAIITTLPGGCSSTVVGGVAVSQCGTTYY